MEKIIKERAERRRQTYLEEQRQAEMTPSPEYSYTQSDLDFEDYSPDF